MAQLPGPLTAEDIRGFKNGETFEVDSDTGIATALTSETEAHVRFVVDGEEIYSLPADEYTRRLVRLLKQADPANETNRPDE